MAVGGDVDEADILPMVNGEALIVAIPRKATDVAVVTTISNIISSHNTKTTTEIPRGHRKARIQTRLPSTSSNHHRHLLPPNQRQPHQHLNLSALLLVRGCHMTCSDRCLLYDQIIVTIALRTREPQHGQILAAKKSSNMAYSPGRVVA